MDIAVGNPPGSESVKGKSTGAKGVKCPSKKQISGFDLLQIAVPKIK